MRLTLALVLGVLLAAQAAPALAIDQAGVVDPDSGRWTFRDHSGDMASFYYGDPGDLPLVGDWDCDGTDGVGVHRPGTGVALLRDRAGSGTADVEVTIGGAGDIVLAGDFDGDGCDSLAVYRPSQSRIKIFDDIEAAPTVEYTFGNPGDVPFVGDFDGDGVDTIGLHRPTTGLVYLRNSHTTGIAEHSFIYGDPADLVISGRWTEAGDGIAVFRPRDNALYLRRTIGTGRADSILAWGTAGGIPVAGRVEVAAPPRTGTAAEDAHAVVMTGLPGAHLDSATEAHLANGGRGIILFSKNLGSAAQVRELTTAASCAAGGSVLVSTDQELGRVTRLAGLVSPTPSALAAAAMSSGELSGVAARLGSGMAGLGVNMNLAPVVDVVRGPNPVLVGRHMGSDPATVAAAGAAYVVGLQSAGVAATAKHFPGHGTSRTDPHLTVTRIDASETELASIDLPPFVAAFGADARAVMIGHPIYDGIDPDRPASISPLAYELLRSFGFDGVAVTDAVSMRGLTGTLTPEDAAVLALAAGADMVLVDRWQSTPAATAAIVAAVAAGDLDRDRLAEAAQRVRRLATWVESPVC